MNNREFTRLFLKLAVLVLLIAGGVYSIDEGDKLWALFFAAAIVVKIDKLVSWLARNSTASAVNRNSKYQKLAKSNGVDGRKRRTRRCCGN